MDNARSRGEDTGFHLPEIPPGEGIRHHGQKIRKHATKRRRNKLHDRLRRDNSQGDRKAEHEKYRKWAEAFKQNHDCRKCPFVKHEVDVGEGTTRDCDAVCGWDVEQIVSEMEGYGAAGGEG
jgi:hypothetical protein